VECEKQLRWSTVQFTAQTATYQYLVHHSQHGRLTERKRREQDLFLRSGKSEAELSVECYLYPTVFTAFIHSIKPGSTTQLCVSATCVATIRHRILYKIFTNKQIQHKQ